MMKKLNLFIAFLFGTMFFVSAQNPPIRWQQYPGGSADERIPSIVYGDSVIFVTSFTLSNTGDAITNHGDLDFMVTALKHDGSKKWAKCYGTPRREKPYGVAKNNSGGIIIVGTISDTLATAAHADSGYEDIWMVSIDANGDTLWQRRIGGPKGDYAWGIIPLRNGSYLVHGATRGSGGSIPSYNGGVYDALTIVITEQGIPVRVKTHGGNGQEEFVGAFELPTGEIIFTGSTNSINGSIKKTYGVPPDQTTDALIVKTDSVGNVMWYKTYGGTFEDRFFGSAPMLDGGFILTGLTRSVDYDIPATSHGRAGQQDAWVLGIDSNGNKRFSKVFGGDSYDMGLAIITLPGDTTFAVGGVTSWPNSNQGTMPSSHGASDSWIAILDTGGKIKSQRCYGGGNDDHDPNSPQQFGLTKTPYGGITIATLTYSNNYGDIIGNHSNGDIWVFNIGDDTTKYPRPDIIPPTISIVTPDSNQVISGIVTITVKAFDETGVANVELYLDSVLIANFSVPPYEIQWDSKSVLDGPHQLMAVAMDFAGNIGSHRIIDTVRNTIVPIDTTSPEDTTVIITDVRKIPELTPKVFPNPTSGTVHINFPTDEPHDIIICDKLGRMVRTTKTQGYITMDLSDLSPGMYFISGNNLKPVKIMVIRN